MSIYLYWGDDEFALNGAAARLRQQSLDPNWADFNYSKLAADQPNAVVQALNLAMTAPFGSGSRFIWLAETTVFQRCAEDLLAELERTLPKLPPETVLLFSTTNKPDGRIKSTKLLQKHAEICEFSLIPAWNTDLIAQQVRKAAQETGVKLTAGAVQALVNSVGSQSRQLYSELEKLRLYAGTSTLDEAAIASLVTNSAQSSYQLAAAIREGDTASALSLIGELLNRNEAPLRIVATLVGYFRTRLWVKLTVEAGDRDDREVARLAEVNNPKQLYFLRQEVKGISTHAFLQTLPILLELEFSLKMGAEPLEALQMKAIELSLLYRRD
ncbi:MAG: DNA polymerase III subunit delta [Pegethrix bostrychoides GSE-TBD4-15B]|jgi:DNA polymerase-3 subunit delta|uniref:DNA polymerase III subunit delta n=1 Tax=Pegethrix bostrychoides GSE-TBD4-15B TaxID=2839662 RepID=A0A951PEF4_9CYAN|nr:DNA polymerase III subunit delta [Pegethrix bostrychoides GSE-TBD4-15B]